MDLQLAVKDAPLELVQPYLAYPAQVGGRVDATLALTGPLAPALALSARGDTVLRRLTVSDGAEPVLTVESIAVTGIDATWPTKLDIDAARVRRSWARLERDATGDLLLRRLFTRAPGPGSPAGAAPPPAPVPPIAVRLREGVFEDGSATIVDGVTTPPARFDIAGARLAIQDFSWPSQAPLKLQLTLPAPAGGTLDADGTLDIGSLALEARMRLDRVEVAPARPYLPINGLVSGQATGDLRLRMAFDPLAVRLEGQARVQRFRLGDEASPLVTVGHAEAAGIDVDWPRRVAIGSVEFRRPRLLIERDAEGEFRLRRLVTPRRPANDRPGATPVTRADVTGPAAAPPSATGQAGPTIQVGTLRFTRATARFIDQKASLSGRSSSPGRRSRSGSSRTNCTSACR